MLKQKKNKGLSLLEAIMALALGSVLLAAVAMMGILSLKNRDMLNTKGELLHQTRLAVARISAELRYATKLLQAESTPHAYLEFETTNLIDADPGVETIRFSRTSGNAYLIRTVDGTGTLYLAGIPKNVTEYITRVTVFEVKPMRVDGGDNLVDLGGSPLSEAVAVQFALTLEDVDSGETVKVSTMVKMRNL